MKNKLTLTAVFFLLFITVSTAQDYKMGLGLRISNEDATVNHSVSFKYFFNESLATEALVTVINPAAFGLLVEKHNPLGTTGIKWFYGGGLYAGFGGERRFGAQGVIGLDYKITSVPLNLSLDWKPELNFTKEFLFEPAAVGISARFTLK
jgi:hypothetical protein